MAAAGRCAHRTVIALAQLNADIANGLRTSNADAPPVLCYRATDKEEDDDGAIRLLEGAVAPGYPYASYRYDSRTFHRARQYLQIVRLGRMAMRTSKGIDKQIELLESYARTGNQPFACHLLVQLHRGNRNKKAASEWMEFGATRGEPESVLLNAK
jgi:hypothetical protein